MKCCGSVPFVFLVLSSLFAVACPAWGASSTYTFSINGESVQPVHYSLNADPSVFAPGDVIYVGDKQFDYGGLYMTLGEERDCRFVTAPAPTSATQGSGAASKRSPRDSRVFLELPDGQRKIVGLKVSWTVVEPNEPAPGTRQGAKKQPSFDRISYNPLDSLSPEEIHGLWGIAFIQWPEGVEQKLAHVNTERVCLTVDDRAGVGGRPGSFFGGPVFPPIPTKTRYLVVEESVSPGLRDFSYFAQFRDLLFLRLRSFPSEPLDAGLICQNTSMRYLDVSGCGIPNWQKLASLTELRFLDISGCRDFANVDFVKDMHQLRTLHVGRTRITSLSPLDNSDSIREIHAGMTLVRDLPKGALPSLGAINLMSTKVDVQAVSQFRQAHPACRIEYGWVDSLRSALQGTTRLRIRSGGTCHRILEQEKTLAEITDAAEISRFINGIGIDESRSNGVCGCCGDPTFEFYAGQRLLAMVGYHHGKRLRWAGGPWTADGELTGPSRDFLIMWLSQHGVEGPRQAREREQEQRTEERRVEDRYAELVGGQTLAAVAEASRKISRSYDPREETRLRVEKQLKAEAEVFEKYEKDTRTSVEQYLRFLGVRNNEAWDSYWENEAVIARQLLPRFKGPELAQAALAVMKDDEGMAGAARWFLGEGGWRNLDESDRERILSPVARKALQHRHAGSRKIVMAALSEINGVWAAEALRGALSRPTDPNWTRPKTKPTYGRKIDLADNESVYADECSEAVWAALCLAKMGNGESLPAIQKLAQKYQGPDKDLLNKAIQLLREKGSKAPAGKE
jgi:hypothetical protein